MENGFMNKVIGLVLVLVIGATLVGGLLVPSIQAVTATETTFENEGYYTMEKYTDGISISRSADTPNQLIVNSETVSLEPAIAAGISTSIIASEIFCLRLNVGSNSYSFQFFAGNSNTSAASDESWTFEAAEGNVTFTNTTTNQSRSSTYSEDIYAIANNGAWCMKQSDKNVYMNGDSFFMGVGLTLGSSALGIVGLNVSGTIEDNATITAWRGTDLTFSNIVVHKTNNQAYNNLYSLDKVTFTATNAENAELDITYSYFIVPAEITAEKAKPMDSGQIAIFGVVSLLGIVLLVTIAASAVRSKY